MTTKSDTRKGVKAMTPKDLAKELKVDPKKLRAYLRKNHTRSAKQHNTSWDITSAQAKAARAHFKGSKSVKAVAKKAPAKRTPRKAKPVAKPVAPAPAPSE